MTTYRSKIQTFVRTNTTWLDDEEELPVLPTDVKQWINVARPYVEGQQNRRTFLTIPFWEEIYEDKTQDIMVVAGRQVYKSTFATDKSHFINPSSKSSCTEVVKSKSF